MSIQKIIFNAFKIILIILVIGITSIVLVDRLWHPLKVEGLEFDVFGGNVRDISIQSRVDFIGVDLHGGYFDFYEYEVNKEDIDRLIKNRTINNFPIFSENIFITKAKSEIKRWSKTPPINLSDNDNFILELVLFGNFNDAKASKRFADANYLKKENNYYAYYAGYPHGVYLYVLVPEESKLFIIRHRT